MRNILMIGTAQALPPIVEGEQVWLPELEAVYLYAMGGQVTFAFEADKPQGVNGAESRLAELNATVARKNQQAWANVMGAVDADVLKFSIDPPSDFEKTAYRAKVTVDRAESPRYG